MADSAHFQIPPGACQLASRRVSFRTTVSDGTLPVEYLEALEQKRRQLDESIHKYIASKEREYKNFEKDLRAQHKAANTGSQARQGTTSLQDQESGYRTSDILPRAEKNVRDSSPPRRRTSSESTAQSFTDFSTVEDVIDGRPFAAVQAILSHGTRARRDSDVIEDEPLSTESKATFAGLTDRRASMERDKDFAGLFTPAYLAAIDDKAHRNGLERTASAPATSLSPVNELGVQHEVNGPVRAASDTIVQTVESARNKRPSQLQVTSRTSSSGSSADGRLASALKSPTQKDRPKRKRVSLAVGDAIVAPSDNVPLAEGSVSHAPSHSRSRVSTSERDRSSLMHPSPLSQASNASPSPTKSPAAEIGDSNLSTNTTPTLAGPQALSAGANIVLPRPPLPSASALAAGLNLPLKSNIDPDGDLFDLEEDSDGGLVNPQRARFDDDDDDGDDDGDADDIELVPGHGDEDDSAITGRVDQEDLYEVGAHISNAAPQTSTEYDPEGGLVPNGDEAVEPPLVVDEHAVHLELRPGSAAASQQPTRPGFRRPSVHADPIFAGSVVDYAHAESEAVEDDVYGSRYVRPESKVSSFRGGSVGESFMERNAAELIRLRAAGKAPDGAKDAGEVRS